jgi:hypothetical protein
MAITKLSNIDNQWFAGGAHVTDTISDSDLAEILNAIIDKTDEIIDVVNAVPAEIQAGSETFAGAASAAVTFATAFTSAPKVVATAQGNVNVWITAITTTGCTINTSAAYTGDVDWIASL